MEQDAPFVRVEFLPQDDANDTALFQSKREENTSEGTPFNLKNVQWDFLTDVDYSVQLESGHFLGKAISWSFCCFGQYLTHNITEAMERI